MKWLHRLIWALPLLTLANTPLWWATPLPGWVKGLLLATLLLLFSWYNLRPLGRSHKEVHGRLRIMLGGREILLSATLLAVGSPLLWIVLYFTGWMPLHGWGIVADAGVFLLVMALMLANGYWRVLVTCKRLRLMGRVLLLTLWWLPPVNAFLLWHACHLAWEEYILEAARAEDVQQRQENQSCRTRYPLLLVHGIFFRDWQLFNYWGRIPKELTRCGATLYYGNQQSARAVADSALELKEQLLKIIAETGCEKVNIIAHSKGGLDARYASAIRWSDGLTRRQTMDWWPNPLPNGEPIWVRSPYRAAGASPTAI